MPRTNDEVAERLKELAILTAIQDGSPQSFRARAYQNGVRAIRGLSRDVSTMTVEELASVKGIGSSIAAKVREYVETGSIDKLDELSKDHPPGQLQLMRVPGLGPKTIRTLWQKLGIADLADLRKAVEAGQLRDLPGLGEKTEANIARALERLELGGGQDRTPIARARPLAERMVEDLRRQPEVIEAVYAGSLRRFRETIGDLDVLVTTDEPNAVIDRFVALPDVVDVLGRGDTKASVVTLDGIQVDLRAVAPGELGAALVYFTGSKAHNIRLRERAQARGLTLNEYALTRLDDGEPVAAATEEDIYAALDLPWITPELREDDGEIELADEGQLPELVTREDLRGDLHDHSDWSGDGRQTMEELVSAAAERGLEYLAITDHAENLSINGISREQMLDQRRQLRELNEQYPEMALLHGAELNISADGELDYDRDFRTGYDWTVASVHSAFNRPVPEQTERLVRAMRDPTVTAIGHLLGRRVGRRPGIEIDVDAVLDVAVETGTAIEINSNLDRLDAPAEIIREGAARGVTFVISTDAHSVPELDNLDHGVRQARRGRLPTRLIANTLPRDRFLDWVAGVKSA